MTPVLSDKQIEAFQDSTARINIFEGPVRAGKSFISLLRWLDFIRNGPKGPLLMCGRTQETIKRNLIDPFRDLIGSSIQFYSGRNEVTIYGRKIYIVGANDERAEQKIRGAEFAGALIDETTLIPQNFFKMLLSRLSIPGAKLFTSTNPDSPYHWLKKDFIDRRDELDMAVFSFSITDNPSLTDKYIEDISKEYKGLWHKRYIQGHWVLAEGVVFEMFDEQTHVIDYLPPATEYIIGIDYGTTNPCVFTLVGYNQTQYPNMWLEKEYYYDSRKEQRQKTDTEYALDFLDFIDGYAIDSIYIDPSAASFRNELRRQGVGNVMDAKNDVLPGLRFMGNLISNGSFKIYATCVNAIQEMQSYSWDTRAQEKGEDKPLKVNDHCTDSARYALYTHFFDRLQDDTFTAREARRLEEAYSWRHKIK